MRYHWFNRILKLLVSTDIREPIFNSILFFCQVNEESVEHMSTADIIDLLRKIRGSIGITVMRKSKREHVTWR